MLQLIRLLAWEPPYVAVKIREREREREREKERERERKRERKGDREKERNTEREKDETAKALGTSQGGAVTSERKKEALWRRYLR